MPLSLSGGGHLSRPPIPLVEWSLDRCVNRDPLILRCAASLSRELPAALPGDDASWMKERHQQGLCQRAVACSALALAVSRLQVQVPSVLASTGPDLNLAAEFLLSAPSHVDPAGVRSRCVFVFGLGMVPGSLGLGRVSGKVARATSQVAELRCKTRGCT